MLTALFFWGQPDCDVLFPGVRMSLGTSGQGNALKSDAPRSLLFWWMPAMSRPSRRWFQVSLTTLFVLTFGVAMFFAGWGVAQRRAERAIRQAREETEAALEASRKAQKTDGRVFSFSMGFAR
jgi:hypothetical protein